ncbi:HesA/MoeB/ThiF family protein [Pseudocolwellia sp. HL-MZ19]|uniref:HesA/MoeB/ThiF family protein n=1 Tax=unclassified Pseudocolwellia TaxID=2848178 RepID=UPI003CE9C577
MLTSKEQLRYSRQIMLKNIGEEGQLSLQNAKVMIVGMGGLGNPVALYLATAGIGHLFIADGDSVDITNLQRQILFTENDLEKNKADTAAEKLQDHNSDITIEVIDEMLDSELCDYYFPTMDLVIDCSDNIQTRYLINQYCVAHKVPLIVGAAIGFDGQQLVVDPRNIESACYHCLFPESKKPPENNCQTVGIVGPVLSIVAGMQSLQAIKLLTGNTIHINQLNLFDGLSNQWQQFKMKKQESCKVCSNNA